MDGIKLNSEKLRQDMIVFSDNTKNIDSMLIYLRAKDLIDVSAKQTIAKQPTHQAKAYEMFHCVIEKAITDMYPILIKALRETGNTHAADELEHDTTAVVLSQPEFVVNAENAHRIVDILEKHPLLKDYWMRVIRELIKIKHWADLEQYHNFSELMLKTLDVWVSDGKSELSVLIKCIEQHNKPAADDLESNKSTFKKQ